MNRVTVSVPGKVNLMGEHAIVHGYPALLAAINLRLYLSVEKIDKGLEILSTEPVDYIKHALEVVKNENKIDDLPPMRIKIISQIPAGYHLGSSAAVAVAVVGAVTYFLKGVWNPIAINQLAYEVEKKMHGNPSGGDNTTVTSGGFVWFRKELEFLKSMWQLPFKLPKHLDHFLLIDTGRPKETTGEMVAFVKERMQSDRQRMVGLMSENETQTKRITLAIKEENEEELMGAMREGERTLEEMGVVSKKVLPLIRKIEDLGGAVKILGGGGRADGVGYLLCYHRESKAVETLCALLGYSIQEIRLGEEGVRIEKEKVVVK